MSTSGFADRTEPTNKGGGADGVPSGENAIGSRPTTRAATKRSGAPVEEQQAAPAQPAPKPKATGE